MKVVLANPRGFCAGVERAVRIVEAALEKYGRPIYVRHEIVHNRHVLGSLAERGAIFVEDLQDIPVGARVIFSAHGVAPTVWSGAQERSLKTLDATCPLVIKVHHEVIKHARAGRTVFVLGHRNHPEVIGTVGHYVSAGGSCIVVIEDKISAETVNVDDPDNVAYVTQTTLSCDQTAETIGILRRRFPRLLGPHRQDICYATQNRQHAVKALAEQCELVIVLGASHSSNSARLREVAEEAGAAAYLVDSADSIDPSWFEGRETVGVTSGASVPEVLVERLLAKFRKWWPDMIEETFGEPEDLNFRMPRELERPVKELNPTAPALPSAASR
jgi:4-hydroxy-3-methylbut-2-enyl diphosphate reductase